jgi:outer membrane lipoprotein carrier protein
MNKLMKIVYGFCGCFFAFLTLTANANDSLQAFYKNVTTLEANFEQVVRDGQGTVLSSSSGRVFLKRPGKFRWSYKAEEGLELGQEIIADGVTVSIYDADLEQLTMRSYRDAVLQVPSLLLVEKGGEIDKYFEVQEAIDTDISEVILSPRSDDAAFSYLKLAFSTESLSGIELMDSIGNITAITLTQVQQNKPIDRQRFQFIPPSGTDIIRQ